MCAFLSSDNEPQVGSAFEFSFTSLTGAKPLPLSQFKGKVVMVVNTASQCGFTSQYEGLEQLYNQFKDRGFVIVGVPSNDFGGQEPGSSDEIASFCKLNYGVTFPLTAKVSLSGDESHPFFPWAKKTLGFGTAPKWNFHKYLIDRDGTLSTYFNSTTSPQAERVVSAVEELLDKPAGSPAQEK